MHVSKHSRGESARVCVGCTVSGQPLRPCRMGSSSSHWTVDGALGVDGLPAVAAQPQPGAASGFSAFALQIHSIWPAQWALRQRARWAVPVALCTSPEPVKHWLSDESVTSALCTELGACCRLCTGEMRAESVPFLQTVAVMGLRLFHPARPIMSRCPPSAIESYP